MESLLIALTLALISIAVRAVVRRNRQRRLRREDHILEQEGYRFVTISELLVLQRAA